MPVSNIIFSRHFVSRVKTVSYAMHRLDKMGETGINLYLVAHPAYLVPDNNILCDAYVFHTPHPFKYLAIIALCRQRKQGRR